MIGTAKMAFKGPSGPITEGTLYLWGDNNSLLLATGSGSPNMRSSPVALGAAADWSTICFSGDGGSAFAIRGGKLFSWGSNSYGQLGLGDVNVRSSPVQVGAATDWVNVWANKESTYGIRRGAAVAPGDPVQGYLYSWGYNANGQLGDGSTTSRSSPVQVGAADGWTYIGVGTGFAMGIRSGKLYGIGFAQYGRSCLAADNSSPVQVGADADWQFVTAGWTSGFGIRGGGLLFTWGYGPNGELGTGALTGPRSSPVPVGGTSRWQHIAAGNSCAMGLLNGQLYAWGACATGLGNGLTNCDSPVQVGAASDWQAINMGTSGDYCFAGIRNGSLFMWGSGGYGQLGQGADIANKGSPVQVGAATDWLASAYRNGGWRNGAGIRP